MHARGGFAAARTERQRVGIGDADRQHRAQKHQAAEKHSSRCNFVHDLSTLAGYSATCERARETQFPLSSQSSTKVAAKVGPSSDANRSEERRVGKKCVS